MEITLKRIKYDKYDELISAIDTSRFLNKENNNLISNVDYYSEYNFIGDSKVIINLDPSEYIDIIRSSKSMGEASIEIAKKLHKELVLSGSPIPRCFLYEKEDWTYLNLTVFFDVVKEKYLYDKTNENVKGKILKYYFNNDNKIDRTGLRYLWVLADLTYFDNDYELTKIAWNFTDTFKAVQESEIGKNPSILKALALAIKKLNYDSRIKNYVNRKLIPKHLRNFACPNMLDSYEEIIELSDVFSTQISILLNNEKLQLSEKSKNKKNKRH